jgi:hypothetical protein
VLASLSTVESHRVTSPRAGAAARSRTWRSRPSSSPCPGPLARSTSRSVTAWTGRSSSTPTVSGSTATQLAGSCAASRGRRTSTSGSARTRFGTRSSPLLLTPVCRCVTCRRRRHTLTRGQRCATTEPASPSTGTPPTSSRPSSPAPREVMPEDRRDAETSGAEPLSGNMRARAYALGAMPSATSLSDARCVGAHAGHWDSVDRQNPLGAVARLFGTLRLDSVFSIRGRAGRTRPWSRPRHALANDGASSRPSPGATASR